jgi:hypothetical protein
MAQRYRRRKAVISDSQHLRSSAPSARSKTLRSANAQANGNTYWERSEKTGRVKEGPDFQSRLLLCVPCLLLFPVFQSSSWPWPLPAPLVTEPAHLLGQGSDDGLLAMNLLLVTRSFGAAPFGMDVHQGTFQKAE